MGPCECVISSFGEPPARPRAAAATKHAPNKSESGAIGAAAFPSVLVLAFSAMLGLAQELRASELEAKAQPQYASTSILDGRQYRSQTIGKDGSAQSDDVLVFRGGNFASLSCRQYGFGESPYWIRLEGGKIHFLAETVSPTHGTILWKGAIQGNKLEATYVWTKIRWYWTIRREYRMKGVLEK
jgi:hypothetical protein